MAVNHLTNILPQPPLPGFFRVNVMYERPLSNSCEILGFFVKSGHVPKAQSMHKWVTFLPNSFCLSGDNAVLQFLRLFDPRDLGAINQDSPVIIVRISINFLPCLKNKLQKTNLIYALICYHHSHCLGMTYYVNFLGGFGSNEFHIKWIFGT